MQNALTDDPAVEWSAPHDDGAWADGQTNGALRTARDTAAAEHWLRHGGFPMHPDPPKNWDYALALIHAVRLTDPGIPILDAGAERYSAFLPALRRLGYTRLTGINLSFAAPEFLDGISLQPGDITRTGFPSSSFGYIACLSVIEHGVDVPRFLAEAARLLADDGHLFLSFDYWDTPVETDGKIAYGVPIRIFTRDDVLNTLRCAAECGLAATGAFNESCVDRVVHWRRFDLRYSFANLLLRRNRR